MIDYNRQYSQQKTNIFHLINNDTQKKPKIRKLLKTGILESYKYASEVTQQEFFKYSNYDPGDYELLESLSELFIDYQKKVTIAKLPKSHGGDGINGEEIKKLEESSPWHLVNKMFKEFGLLHTISYPEFTAADLISTQALSFQVKLYINDEEIDFEDLSSGEKILCALAITVYQDTKSKFPELLLLDEVDASLHPSMIQHLLDVIGNVFIKNECKVILATHSPTTVALAMEKSLFEVQKGKEQQKIRKISQADAIDLLSEGIITFEKGLKIQNSIDHTKMLQVLTEGNNTEHIKKAIEVLDNKLLTNINVIEGSPDKRGGQQLKNAYHAFSSAKHESIFLFVWDCDFASKINDIVETDKFKKFCFAENIANTKRDKNSKARGIENLYSDDLFTDEVYSTKVRSTTYGGQVSEKKFEKHKFLEKIKQQSNRDVFQNFLPLIEEIKKHLGSGI